MTPTSCRFDSPHCACWEHAVITERLVYRDSNRYVRPRDVQFCSAAFTPDDVQAEPVSGGGVPRERLHRSVNQCQLSTTTRAHGFFLLHKSGNIFIPEASLASVAYGLFAPCPCRDVTVL